VFYKNFCTFKMFIFIQMKDLILDVGFLLSL